MEPRNGAGLGVFRRTLGDYKRLALDTSIMVYFLESVPRFQPYVGHLLKEVEAGRLTAVVSVVVELELLVKPLRLENWQAAQDIREFMSGLPNLEIVPTSRSIAQRAALVRARSRIGVPDSIIISTAVEASCDAVVGNDIECAKRIADLPYLCLEDFISRGE
ncbi:MAG: PIN domain-containing protein [Chloroflexi bacterium]|nr:PIN domain-containing protein [Chloroflexota bacterium]